MGRLAIEDDSTEVERTALLGRELQSGGSRMVQLFLRSCSFLRSFQHGEEGQDMVEYSLLVSLIALTLIASINQLATALINFFTNVSSALV